MAVNSQQSISLTSGNNTLTNLSIYDSTDSLKLYNTNTTFFYANWTNLSNGVSINSSNVFCNITFSFLDNEWENMVFNSSTLLYTYSGTVRTGQNNYTIACDGSALGYGLVNVNNKSLI